MVEDNNTKIEGAVLQQPTEIELSQITSFDKLPKWTEPLTHGPFMNFKEARKEQMEGRYSDLTDKKLIGEMNKEKRKKYVAYLKKVRDLILNTPLEEMENRKFTQSLGFTTELNNKSLEKYVKGEKLTLNDLSEENFVKDTFQTREQALSRDRKGARLTSALIDPNKTSEIMIPELINQHIDTEWDADKIIIRFDSLKYMKALFEKFNYDKPFEFETDDEFNFTGQLAIEEDGELLSIPDTRLIVVGGDDIPIDMVGSYIEGEGLANNTVITRPKNKGKIREDERDKNSKVIAEYEYITISPPKRDTESTKKNQYKLTVVHSNVNSIVGVTDNRSKETEKASNDKKHYIYWMELIDSSGSYDFMKDKDLYAVYSAERGKPLVDFTTAEKMTNELKKIFTRSYVSTKDDRIPYTFKSTDEPIGAIIASALKPRGQETRKVKLGVFDTVIPLGTVEIILKTKVYEQIKALGGKEGKKKSRPKNPRVMSLIKNYKKYKDIIEAFDKAITQGQTPTRTVMEDGKKVMVEEGEGENKKKVPLTERGPFTEFERMVPNATAEDFNDLLDIYEGSDSRGYSKGRDVYRALLFMADKDIDADALKQAAQEGTDDKVIAAAIEVLEGLTGEKKERPKEFSSSDFLLDFIGIGFGVGGDKIKLEKKTPLVAVEEVNYEFRKQINLSGQKTIAGKETEGKIPTYDVKGNKGRLQQLIRGIRQFNRRIEALDG